MTPSPNTQSKANDCCEKCFKWGKHYGEYAHPYNNTKCDCHIKTPQSKEVEMETPKQRVLRRISGLFGVNRMQKSELDIEALEELIDDLLSSTKSKEVEWEKEFLDESLSWIDKNKHGDPVIKLGQMMEFIKNVIMETEVRCGIRAFKEVMLEREATESRVRREICDHLLENGHGGGNWRRLIITLKETNE